MAYTYTQTLYDAFPGSSLNTSLWTDASQAQAAGQIAVSGGILSLQAKANYQVEVDARQYFDLTTGLWAVKWGHTGTASADTSGAGTAGTEVYFGFADAAGNYFELQTYPASDEWWAWNAAGNGQYATGTTGNQDAFGSAWTAGNWIGIGDYNLNNDNRLLAYSSPDGVTWTEIASWAVSGPVDMHAVELLLGTYQHTGSSTWVSQFQDASTFLRSTAAGTGAGTGAGGVPVPPVLGMYETGGAFPGAPAAWPCGPSLNLTATYMAWGQDITQYVEPFVTQCNSNGITPFVELEPWHSGSTWNVTPLFTDITGGLWDTWLEQLGTYIASTGKACVLTFGHEMNVNGQYPWSQGALPASLAGNGSGPGHGTLTPAQWIAGWNYVRAKVNSTAGGLAVWMWACNAYTGGTTVDPTPWWPGAPMVDMVGIDSYPNAVYGASLGTFAGQLQPTVTILRGLGWTNPIFISETNLAQMVSSGGQDITSFVADMYAAGVSGVLEFEDASWSLPKMSAEQWAQYNGEVAALYGTPGTGGGTGTGSGGTGSGSGSSLWYPGSLAFTGNGAGNAGTIGTHFTTSAAATLRGLALDSAAGQSLTGVPAVIGLFDTATRALVHSETAAWSGAAGSGWITASFASPPALSPGASYMAAAFLDSTAPWFAFDDAYAYPASAGPLTAPDGGWYDNTGTTAIAYPASQLSGYNWGLDVIVGASAAAASPLAVVGIV